MRRPTKREDLIKYFEALHDALSRELTCYPTDLSVRSLREACIHLESRLEGVPRGEELLENARHNAVHADERFFVGLAVIRGEKDLDELEAQGLLGWHAPVVSKG